jgi:hypothetical protein
MLQVLRKTTHEYNLQAIWFLQELVKIFIYFYFKKIKQAAVIKIIQINAM